MSFTDRAVYWTNEFKDHPGGDPNASRPVLAGVGINWVKANQSDGTRFPTPAKYRQFLSTHHVTDCITYVTDVMKYAYLDIGNEKMARIVKQPSMLNHGADLAKYLVEMEGWKGYYWNPDAELSDDREEFDEDPELSIGSYCHYNVRPYGGVPSKLIKLTTTTVKPSEKNFWQNQRLSKMRCSKRQRHTSTSIHTAMTWFRGFTNTTRSE